MELLGGPGGELQFAEVFRTQVYLYLFAGLGGFLLCLFFTDYALQRFTADLRGMFLCLQLELAEILARGTSYFGHFRAILVFVLPDQSLAALVLPPLELGQVETVPGLEVSHLQQNRVLPSPLL